MSAVIQQNCRLLENLLLYISVLPLEFQSLGSAKKVQTSKNIWVDRMF